MSYQRLASCHYGRSLEAYITWEVSGKAFHKDASILSQDQLLFTDKCTVQSCSDVHWQLAFSGCLQSLIACAQTVKDLAHMRCKHRFQLLLKLAMTCAVQILL